MACKPFEIPGMVSAAAAAKMMGLPRSTFRSRINAGKIKKPKIIKHKAFYSIRYIRMLRDRPDEELDCLPLEEHLVGF